MSCVRLLWRAPFVAAILLTLRSVAAVLEPTVVDRQILWEGGSTAEVASFRIPAITNTPDGSALVAMSEARKFGISDAGAKFLTQRRSTNGGSSWSTVELLVEDFQTADGLNVGSLVVDHEENTLILLYNYCVHETCSGGNNGSYVYMIKSKDGGNTWSKPNDISVESPSLKGVAWAAGPGYGIQKTMPPNKGRLVACGHLISLKGSREGLYCLTSDDHGKSWEIGASLPGIPNNVPKKKGDFAISEPQIVEMANGSLLCFTRNTYGYHCSCKVVSRSDDGGDTFPIENVYFDDVLIDPGCAGSALILNGVLFHLNPASISGRKNLTLRWSLDEGKTWEGALTIDPGFSGYSCLTKIDDNNIGLMYETAGYKDITFVKVRLHS